MRGRSRGGGGKGEPLLSEGVAVVLWSTLLGRIGYFEVCDEEDKGRKVSDASLVPPTHFFPRNGLRDHSQGDPIRHARPCSFPGFSPRASADPPPPHHFTSTPFLYTSLRRTGMAPWSTRPRPYVPSQLSPSCSLPSSRTIDPLNRPVLLRPPTDLARPIGRKDARRLVPRAGYRALRVFPAFSRSVLLFFLPFLTTSPSKLTRSLRAGVRTQDNIKRFQTVPVPGTSLSPEELNAAVDRLELLIAENGRKLHEAGGQGIERLPGVNELLNALRAGGARWGICTSGTLCFPLLRFLHASSRSSALFLSPHSLALSLSSVTLLPSPVLASSRILLTPRLPPATRNYANSALTTGEIGSTPPSLPFLITANDVVNGKPNPDPYLKGMEGAFPIIFLLRHLFLVSIDH